jgi:chromosome segregation ATPase
MRFIILSGSIAYVLSTPVFADNAAKVPDSRLFQAQQKVQTLQANQFKAQLKYDEAVGGREQAQKQLRWAQDHLRATEERFKPIAEDKERADAALAEARAELKTLWDEMQ